MRSIFTIFFIISLSSIIQAQDIHLTQYYTSNISLNPANTGNYLGDLRFTSNYRTQWKQVTAPIRTSMFSAEKKLLKFPDEFGAGILFVNDQLSTFNLQTNKLVLSGSYQKDIKNNIVRIGLQTGMTFRNTDYGDQTFPTQWNYGDGNFDQTIGNRETDLQNNYNYLDLNAGANWTRVFNTTKVSAGYALFHINKPKDGFTNIGKDLAFRHVFNSSAVFHLSPVLSVTPHMLYMSAAKATDFIIGSNANRKLNNDITAMIGAGFRGSTVNGDAVLTYAGITYKRIEFGASFDYNISELSSNRNKSAVEFSIIYTTPARYTNKVTIPCDRF